MRYQEERRKRKQHGIKKVSSNDKGENSLRRSREARMMDELAVIFQAGSLQDYTPVLEWESKKVNSLTHSALPSPNESNRLHLALKEYAGL
jgi:hypothetical protein